MSDKEFTLRINLRTAQPRSRRLRKLGSVDAAGSIVDPAGKIADLSQIFRVIKEFVDMFEFDTESVPGKTLIKAKHSLYSVEEIAAGGVPGTSGSGETGGSALRRIAGWSGDDADGLGVLAYITAKEWHDTLTAMLGNKADLVSGKVPASQLPPSLTLGETASTAYAGNKGAANATDISTLKGYFLSSGKAKDADKLDGHDSAYFAPASSLQTKADLVEGKVPASQLPSFVDDVLEFGNLAAFPSAGEGGKIYIDASTNLTYRWSGSAYVPISQSLALGETASTAYPGNKGAANAAAILILQSYFANGRAKDADKLEGHSLSYFASAANLATELSERQSADTALSNRIAALESLFGVDSDGNLYVKNGRNFYTEGHVSAGGHPGSTTVIPVTGLSISGPAAVNTGSNQAQYTVEYTPSGTTQIGVIWSIQSGGTYASIDSNGLLTVKPGASGNSVTIKATSTENSSVISTKTISVTYQAAVVYHSLTVNATPSGCTIAVTVNGSARTYSSGMQIEHNASVEVTVSKSGYVTQTQSVTMDTDKMLAIALVATPPVTYSLGVLATPPNALVLVFVNGEGATYTPEMQIEAGAEVWVEVTAEGYQGYSTSFMITEDVFLNVVLEQETNGGVTLLQSIEAPAATAGNPAPYVVLPGGELSSFEVNFRYSNYPTNGNTNSQNNPCIDDLVTNDNMRTVVQSQHRSQGKLVFVCQHGPSWSSGGGSSSNVTFTSDSAFKAVFSQSGTYGKITIKHNDTQVWTLTKNTGKNTNFSPRINAPGNTATTIYGVITINGIEYHPALQNGIAGFYCISTQAFYPSQNEVSFIAGPAV